ncbi:multiple C2 and transmembrane domain-containing protein isoform X2 [Papilio machaon]|uniref:multiple C2 and transmembrane domain-containing protein isoform X2 n=1 Tax=Papilio machaon TaxID=76193 RepID=UPI001E663051|nr:multiple C2 and transmembrane domain-containing protein isoform X2 [Papilio machaon]
MSFRRNRFFRTKSVLEYHETETQSEFSLTNGNVCKQKSVPSSGKSMQADVLYNKVSEDVILNDSINFKTTSFDRDNELMNKVCDIEVNPNVDASVFKGQPQTNLEERPSIPIPDSLAMDPLAPTALAVSSDFMDRIGSGLTLLRDHGKKVQKYLWKSKKLEVTKKSLKTQVNIVLVDARDLPDEISSNTNGLYCKFRLGNESHKSKQVTKSKPEWRERFNIYMYEDSNLEVKVWHKGKQKTFVGRCVIDLSQLERERTHELWQELEYGYGSIHMLVTLGGSERCVSTDNLTLANGVTHQPTITEEKYTWYRLENNWNEVGQLSVTVHGARGLSSLGLNGNIDAYCVLEVDNARVQTHAVRNSSDPTWNKNFIFNINDVTSTLDITIYDESIIQSMKGETLGKISIPLLRINNNEKKWYALKDRSKKHSAKGNCPRILLEMSLEWNPIKASFRVLSPKPTKYVEKPPKFSIPLIYNNLKFIKVVFDYIYLGNVYFKNTFEWENREKSALALGAWLLFWYFFRMWMMPLLLIVPFLPYWAMYRGNNCSQLLPILTDEDTSEEDSEIQKDDKTISTRLYELQDLTFTIKNGIDYIVSIIERLKNLINFSVPYLSYLAIIGLIVASIAFYLIPVNYLFMALGIYKFTRKAMNPNRVPNNDILDFISRVPDNEILKQWRELKVTESSISRSDSMKRR